MSRAVVHVAPASVTVEQAIVAMKQLGAYDPWWIEEPTSPDGILGHARIRREIAPVRVATGEHVQNRVINSAAGNATLASLIHNLAGGMMRARLWRTATEHDAVDITRRRHRDIYLALRAGDAGRASAADLIHLAENERWLEMMLASGELSRPHADRDVRLRRKPPGRSPS